jgi:hypothetical protein
MATMAITKIRTKLLSGRIDFFITFLLHNSMQMSI